MAVERFKIVTHLQKLQVFDTLEKKHNPIIVLDVLYCVGYSPLWRGASSQLEVAVKFRNEPKSDFKGFQFSSNL